MQQHVHAGLQARLHKLTIMQLAYRYPPHKKTISPRIGAQVITKIISAIARVRYFRKYFFSFFFFLNKTSHNKSKNNNNTPYKARVRYLLITFNLRRTLQLDA